MATNAFPATTATIALDQHLQHGQCESHATVPDRSVQCADPATIKGHGSCPETQQHRHTQWQASGDRTAISSHPNCPSRNVPQPNRSTPIEPQRLPQLHRSRSFDGRFFAPSSSHSQAVASILPEPQLPQAPIQHPQCRLECRLLGHSSSFVKWCSQPGRAQIAQLWHWQARLLQQVPRS